MTTQTFLKILLEGEVAKDYVNLSAAIHSKMIIIEQVDPDFLKNIDSVGLFPLIVYAGDGTLELMHHIYLDLCSRLIKKRQLKPEQLQEFQDNINVVRF